MEEQRGRSRRYSPETRKKYTRSISLPPPLIESEYAKDIQNSTNIKHKYKFKYNNRSTSSTSLGYTKTKTKTNNYVMSSSSEGNISNHSINVMLSPPPTNWVKIRQVLSYDHSLEKLSRVIGVDVEKVKDIKVAQFEEAMTKERATNGIKDKKTTQKALEFLGHDPSVEKAKRTLGMGEAEIEKARMEKQEIETSRLQKIRSLDTPYDKKKNSKAFHTLGFNPSNHRSMKILGLNEPQMQKALDEELERVEKTVRTSRRNLASRNRRDNRKALEVIGHNPSKEKVVGRLGHEVSKDTNWIPVKGL